MVANKLYLIDMLRHELEWEGLLKPDYHEMANLFEWHMVTNTSKDAARIALTYTRYVCVCVCVCVCTWQIVTGALSIVLFCSGTQLYTHTYTHSIDQFTNPTESYTYPDMLSVVQEGLVPESRIDESIKRYVTFIFTHTHTHTHS